MYLLEFNLYWCQAKEQEENRTTPSTDREAARGWLRKAENIDAKPSQEAARPDLTIEEAVGAWRSHTIVILATGLVSLVIIGASSSYGDAILCLLTVLFDLT